MSARAVAPVVGVVLLVAVAVVAATAVGALLVVDPLEPAASPPTASFQVTADETGAVAVTHRGGDAVEPNSLEVHVRVDGEPLAEQPPVPFFSASGFESGPTGAFNSATVGNWRAGETASLRIAETNDPTPTPGSTVEVRLYVDGTQVAALETRA